MNHSRHNSRRVRILLSFSASAVAFLTLMLTSFPLRGAEPFPEPPPNVKTYEWDLSPANEPRFALQYKLLPPLNERIPGNSATYYFRAVVLECDRAKDSLEQLERMSEWYDMPYDKLPLDEVKKWLAGRNAVVAELNTAVQCETCDWGTRFQDLRGEDVITVRLQEFQQSRQLARILRLKVRIEIAEKRFDDAIGTCRQLYRLAHDLGTVPSVIVNLVGIAVQSLANESVGELIATEGSPNMYWALRGLPEPVIDMRRAWQFEWTMASRMFPFLNDADTAQRTPLEWRQLLAKTNVEYNSNDPAFLSLKNQAYTTILVLRSYPIAKRELIAAGYDAAKIEQMPVGQVVAIYIRDCHRHVADELIKWGYRPVPPTIKEVRGIREKLQQDGYLRSSDEFVPDRDPFLINSELGYFENLFESNHRQPRSIAALTAIEAIRMHAAVNGGRLPASLDEITVVPVPVNPSTKTPMLYRVIDNRAELLVPPTRPGDAYSGRRYLLRIRAQ